jgi:hypothetical protein
LEVYGVAGLEKLVKSWRLRDVKRKKLVMIQVPRDHDIYGAPPTTERNYPEKQPAMLVREVRSEVDKSNSQEPA